MTIPSRIPGTGCAAGKYDELEFGFFKYPHCFCGESWSCDANVIAPYSGTWHVASRIYRKWVDTWWDHREPPQWVKEMKSWQRVIFKHQYGEYLFRYPDMNGVVDEAGRSVGCNALFLFGWWAEGMDHGNPDYSPDESQGGDAALKAEIARYQAAGNHLLLYYNGKLIDRESRFYRSGMGPKVCRHDNTGSEILERYKFTGQGTWLGEYDQRTFAVATMMEPDWNRVLFDLQDRAYALGAHSVFFDQLGYIEQESANWDTSREYPVPDVFGIRKRAACLKLLRDRYAGKAPDFALGAEATVDALAQYCDYTHGYPANDGPHRWINFFRYTFPEFIFTDRGLRDDVDAVRHVNNTVLDGQRNDIEIFRCRGIISDAPVYQAYLKQVNALKDKYKECLLLGRYNDCFGFTLTDSRLDARSFLSADGRKMAVVVAHQDPDCPRRRSATVKAPGFRLADADATGTGRVSGNRVKLGQFDMAVLLFERDPAAVRIGTYNLRRAKLDDKDPDNNWAAREPRLIQSFLDNDFDICGVQEVDSAEQERLPRLLAERGRRYGVHFFGPYADDGVGTRTPMSMWRWRSGITRRGFRPFSWGISMPWRRMTAVRSIVRYVRIPTMPLTPNRASGSAPKEHSMAGNCMPSRNGGSILFTTAARASPRSAMSATTAVTAASIRPTTSRSMRTSRSVEAYPRTTSSTIIRANPRANPTVPMLECFPCE